MESTGHGDFRSIQDLEYVKEVIFEVIRLGEDQGEMNPTQYIEKINPSGL